MYNRFGKIFIIVLLILNSLLFASFDSNYKIICVRVEFPTDENEGTSGVGKFILENEENYCANYTIDPPPHDKHYFASQLKAVDNYFRTVSKQHFGIDLINSAIYPSGLQDAYLMPNEMGYYHPLASELDEDERKEFHEERVTQLFHDAITTAYQVDNIDFSQYDAVVVFHAGISQDFNIDLDTTPEDIPSSYINEEMVREYYGSNGIEVGNANIKDGIILPETQNHIFYDEFVDYYQNNGIQDVCEYQYGLTGTFAIMIAQSIGLPPLWNTESGQSGVGRFGLLDQGSNNGHGLIPAMPSAWSRILMGWEEVETIIPDRQVIVESQPSGKVLKVNINENEYFLIENRTNWFRSTVNLDSSQLAVYFETDTIPNLINFIIDSVGVVIDDNGVIITVPDYDIGLPGSGLLIWHIDEGVINNNINSDSINNDPKHMGVDLEEAGGPQDIGYVSTALFRDPSIGEPFDMWYAGNLEYQEINPTIDGTIEFSSFTYPNTRSNRGSTSNITIGQIGNSADTMQIFISNNLNIPGFPDTTLSIIYNIDFNRDGKSQLIGGDTELWWSETDNIDKKIFYELPSEKNYYVVTNSNQQNQLVVLSEIGDSLKTVWIELRENMEIVKSEIIENTNNAILHISGHYDSPIIDIYEEYDSLYLKNVKVNTNIPVSISDGGGITIGDQLSEYDETIFQYISAIDLDTDGNLEILALDGGGILYAFNQNYTLVSGFPIDFGAKAPVLAKDIMGDQGPEIVFKNLDGDIIILNNIGEIQYQISGYKNSALVMLGEYNNRNTIVTESNILLFDHLSNNNGNEWTTYYGDENNTKMITIDYISEINSKNKLFDKKKSYVYPNPVKGNIAKFRLFNYSADKIEIKIYDSAGYFVNKITDNIDITNGVWETEWDVSSIESGIYLVKLTVQQGNDKESLILKLGVIH